MELKNLEFRHLQNPNVREFPAEHGWPTFEGALTPDPPTPPLSSPYTEFELTTSNCQQWSIEEGGLLWQLNIKETSN